MSISAAAEHSMERWSAQRGRSTGDPALVAGDPMLLDGDLAMLRSSVLITSIAALPSGEPTASSWLCTAKAAASMISSDRGLSGEECAGRGGVRAAAAESISERLARMDRERRSPHALHISRRPQRRHVGVLPVPHAEHTCT